MALIQPGQRQYQSARYLGYRSKKLLSQQDGRMKKHLHNFMIGEFKWTFQTIYLDEICCVYIWCFCIFVYIYGVIDSGNIYGVNHVRNNINQIEKTLGLLIISSGILSNPHLYDKAGPN